MASIDMKDAYYSILYQKFHTLSGAGYSGIYHKYII